MKRAIVLMVSLLLAVSLAGAQSTEKQSAQALLEKKLPELNFDKLPLKDVINFLQDVTGANIAVDWAVLEKAGIKKSAPVTARLRDISMGKALSTILNEVGGEQVKLAYAVDRDVITISTATVIEKVERKVFDLHDLIAPVRGDPPKRAEAMKEQIVKLVKETVSPEKWGKDGRSIIERDGQLIVAASKEDMASVEALLAQLREQRGLQVMIEVKFITLPKGFLPDLEKQKKPLSGAEAEKIINDVKANQDATLMSSPRIMMRNGEEASYMTGGETPSIANYKAVKKANETKYEPVTTYVPWGTSVKATGVISSDRKSVRLEFNPKITVLKEIAKTPWMGEDGKGAPAGAKDLQITFR
jgi:type II secretory pathway component GspD/PulD (secretin)